LHKLDEFYTTGYEIVSDSGMKEYLCNMDTNDLSTYELYMEGVQEQITKAYYRSEKIQIHIYTENSNLPSCNLLIRDKQLFEKKQALVKGIFGFCLLGTFSNGCFQYLARKRFPTGIYEFFDAGYLL